MNKYKSEGLHIIKYAVVLENQRKKLKLDPHDILVLRCSFIRSNFLCDADLPKSVLLRYSQRCRKPAPKYTTRNMNKLFQSMVIYDGKKYSSTCWLVFSS